MFAHLAKNKYPSKLECAGHFKTVGDDFLIEVLGWLIPHMRLASREYYAQDLWRDLVEPKLNSISAAFNTRQSKSLEHLMVVEKELFWAVLAHAHMPQGAIANRKYRRKILVSVHEHAYLREESEVFALLPSSGPHNAIGPPQFPVPPLHPPTPSDPLSARDPSPPPVLADSPQERSPRKVSLGSSPPPVGVSVPLGTVSQGRAGDIIEECIALEASLRVPTRWHAVTPPRRDDYDSLKVQLEATKWRLEDACALLSDGQDRYNAERGEIRRLERNEVRLLADNKKLLEETRRLTARPPPSRTKSSPPTHPKSGDKQARKDEIARWVAQLPEERAYDRKNFEAKKNRKKNRKRNLSVEEPS